jgi:hypothetical protein
MGARCYIRARVRSGGQGKAFIRASAKQSGIRRKVFASRIHLVEEESRVRLPTGRRAA